MSEATKDLEEEIGLPPGGGSRCRRSGTEVRAKAPNSGSQSRRFPISSILVRLMKTTLRSTFAALILSTMLLASGCEKKTAATDPTAQSTPGSTKLLQAADLVGYDGKRLRKSVDRIREGNEKHNQELEKMAGSGPEP